MLCTFGHSLVEKKITIKKSICPFFKMLFAVFIILRILYK